MRYILYCDLFRAVSFDQNEHEAIVTFNGGNTDSADVVICADGIHSIGKNYIISDETLRAPEHTGYCVYYGIFERIDESIPDKATVLERMYSNLCAVCRWLKYW